MPADPYALRELADLRRHLQALGARQVHEQRVLRLWTQALPQDSGRRKLEDFLPATLRAGLPALTDALAGLARLRSEHPAQDGSARLLVELADGQTVAWCARQVGIDPRTFAKRLEAGHDDLRAAIARRRESFEQIHSENESRAARTAERP